MAEEYLVSKKYHEISILARETVKQVSKNGKEWAKYLTTAARLYRYPFEDQMLIYAQRPDAKACTVMEIWNEKMFCWVNRGAKGIALFDRESKRPRLKYVFDVSDVHKARRIGKDLYLWEIREEHKDIVLAQLEKTYGVTDSNSSFESRLIEIAGRIAEDYYKELLSDMSYAKEGSFLEELDEWNVGLCLRETLSASIAYTLLSRCGTDMDLWKDELNFDYIHEFNTTKALSVVGNATTDMCKPILMEIGKSVMAYDRQIARNKVKDRTNKVHTNTIEKNPEKMLVNTPEIRYNALKRESVFQTRTDIPLYVTREQINKNKETESVTHETNIRKERGLSDTQPDTEQRAKGTTNQVWSDARELPEGTQKGDLQWAVDDRRVESTLSGNTETGRGENGFLDRADGESGGSGRSTESSRPDEMGSKDEQYQTLSGGNRTDGASLQSLNSEIQLNMETKKPDNDYNSRKESVSGSFLQNLQVAEEVMEIQKEILCSDDFLIHKRPEIAGYFAMEKDTRLQTEYFKNSFLFDMYYKLNVDGTFVGFYANEEGIHINISEKVGTENEMLLLWEDARFFVNSYIEDGVYLLPREKVKQLDIDGMYQQLDLFSLFTEQVGSIVIRQAEQGIIPAERTSSESQKNEMSKEQLDAILRSGSGKENSRKHIYGKYQQGKTPEEMVKFLKKEYGTTGKGFEFNGKQLSVWFNQQGMIAGNGTSALENPKFTMSWQEIEKEIRLQVESGTYMSANEAYLVDEVERGRIAKYLFFFFRDGMGEMPEELELKNSNFPNSHARLTELLSTPEGVNMVASYMDKALRQLESGEKKLRFRFVMPKEELRAELDNLLLAKKTFPMADNVEVKKEDFITQDEIDYRLGSGSSHHHSSFRIYDYYMEGHDSREAEEFLKKEYGTGGSSNALAGTDHSWEDHDVKGIHLKKGDLSEPYADVLLPWKAVEKRIRKLIQEDKYLSPEDKAAFAEYKKEQAQKELEKVQEKMEHDTKVSCKYAIEKAIAENFDGYRLPKGTAETVIKEYGTERVSYVLANSVMYRKQEEKISSENKEWAKLVMPSVIYENQDIVVSSHPAILNGFMNQARRYIEHEKELAVQAEKETSGHNVQKVNDTIFIDGQECIRIDEWKSDDDVYVIGNSVEDSNFFYAKINENTHFEYDHKPDRAEIENDFINIEAMRDIDRHEVEVFSRFEGSDDFMDIDAVTAHEKLETPERQVKPKIDKSGAVNFHITDGIHGTDAARTSAGFFPKEKFKRNIEAIRTLKKIESENRIATLKEQKVLAQYVGWGGLADAFDENKSAWAGEYQELKSLLSDVEYASARESTLNAHYTSPVIIRSIYKVLDKMGFEKGNVLEPAMGIGNFFGMLPEKMQDSKLYGVELDGITGRIAKQLYPKANIKISGFEKTDYPNDFFDIAVGNVPFGQYKVADRKYDKNNFLIHDYFFGATRS